MCQEDRLEREKYFLVKDFFIDAILVFGGRDSYNR